MAAARGHVRGGAGRQILRCACRYGEGHGTVHEVNLYSPYIRGWIRSLHGRDKFASIPESRQVSLSVDRIWWPLHTYSVWLYRVEYIRLLRVLVGAKLEMNRGLICKMEI